MEQSINNNTLEKNEYYMMKNFDFKGDGWCKIKNKSSDHPKYSKSVKNQIKKVIIPFENA